MYDSFSWTGGGGLRAEISVGVVAETGVVAVVGIVVTLGK